MDSESDQGREAMLAFFQRVGRDCFPDVARCTVPLYAAQGEGFVLLGSGVLLQIGEHYFALSAAHVLDVLQSADSGGLPLFTTTGPGGKGLVPFAKIRAFRSKKRSSSDRSDDPYDMGVAYLPPQLAQDLLPHRRFLRLYDLDLVDPQEPSSWYLIFGYPSTLSRLDLQQRKLDHVPLPYGTTLYQGERGPVENHREDIGIALNFTPQDSTDSHGSPVQLPRPNGISGGGIWRLLRGGEDVAQWNPAMTRLVAIEHTWKKHIHVLIGTRIFFAMKLICRNFPELVPAVAMVYPTQSWKS